MNALIKYPGGKWKVADWIISFMPKHKIYLEPYAGGLAVFFNKKPSQYETLNDIDGRICNLFKVCRDKPGELAALLQYTPYAREEYESVMEGAAGQEIKLTGNGVEDARRFIVRINQAISGTLADRVGWKNKKICSDGATFPYMWSLLPKIVIEASGRLKMAQIENRPANELIVKYNSKDCLIYADPPYLMNTRKGRLYTNEMGTVPEHEEMLKLLLKHEGPVILSGYDNDLYNRYLDGWHTEERQTNANSAAVRTEKLWMNFEFDKQISFDMIRR